MKPSRFFKQVVIVMMLATLLWPVHNVGAVTYENITGNAYSFQYQYYSRAREIVDASSSGWDVAFRMDSGPFGLELGAWDCWYQGYLLGSGNPPHLANSGYYTAVAHPLSDGVTFCIVTASNASSGVFTGRLGWD